MPFPRQVSLWIGYALISLVVLGILALIVNPDLLPQVDLSQKKHSLPLIICLLLAGLLPLLLIPGLWYETRIRDYMSRTVPALTDSLSPAALRAILILVVFAILLPTLFYVVPPFMREIKSALFNPPPETTLVTRIDEVSTQAVLLNEPSIQQPVNNAFLGLVSVLNTQLRACQKSQINQMIYDLQAISASDPHGNPLLVQKAINELNVIRETADIACRVELIGGVMTTLKPTVTTTLNQALPNEPNAQQCQAQWQSANNGQDVLVEPACYNYLLTAMLVDLEMIQNAPPPYSAASSRSEILAGTRLLAVNPNLMPSVQAQITHNISTLENSLATVTPPEPPLIEWRFLLFWFTAVSLTWLGCTICAFSALNQRIEWLDLNVPHPIFTSVANMTRVAIWEAKQALESLDTKNVSNGCAPSAMKLVA
ncbi:MAG: hypothetical protein HC804_07565 [Anaerolineae bacterium]|nr:hypothetical protein [Anaerolineae bacterium]